MVTIGNSTLPGVQTTVESSRSVGVGLGSAGRAVIVGHGDYSAGTADSNTVYEVRTPTRARTFFGNDSPLTTAIIDALREGAFPVYGVAAHRDLVENETVTNQTGTLADAPLTDDASHTVFTVDGIEKTTIITFSDPAEVDVGDDEVYVNPVTGEYALDAAPATDGLAEYHALDYDGAIEAVEHSSESFDFVSILDENEDTIHAALDGVDRMVANYDFAIVLAGASPSIDDVYAYSNPFDSSRLQLVYPSRNADGESIIGTYAGLRASLGISSSPMRKRVAGQNDLMHSLSTDDMEALLAERVNPIADEASGSRVIDDVTTVSELNDNESEMAHGLSRLIVDFVTVVVQRNADNFIGELHTQAARNALQSSIKSELKDMMELSVIQAYTVSVEHEDAMTASVDVGVETTKPLRNIVATVSAGNVD